MTTYRPVAQKHIRDYALIGDQETAALINRDCSIDWLCWPRFDSQACFAALLGTDGNGCWRIGPKVGEASCTRRYRGETLILETTIETPSGRAMLIDFMPLRGEASQIVRIVRCTRGSLDFVSSLALLFGYGRDPVEWRRAAEGIFVATSGGRSVYLSTDRSSDAAGGAFVSIIKLSEGQSASFVLSFEPTERMRLAPADPELLLRDTAVFWAEWVSRCSYRGPWRAAVIRSLITLKALIYRPSGGIVAAATSSLPERLGGARNWDYRYCWVRDATFTLLAFIHSGYVEEAIAWRDWLMRTLSGEPHRIQPLYGMDGEPNLDEWEVDWLQGFRRSLPVRIGNAAFRQHQLDTFGELIDVLHQMRMHGMGISAAAWDMQTSIVRHLEQVWTCPDSGIWESRDKAKRYTYSQAMIWVALNRTLCTAKALNLDVPFARWTALCDKIHNEVCRLGFDSSLNSFVQSYGCSALDASTLLLPQIGFLPPDDPRIVGTVDAIGKKLCKDGFIFRDDMSVASDGLPPGEAAFIACNFWYADALKMMGRNAEAIEVFERTSSISNDLGLLSEEHDPASGQLLGNFPQALSHLALVNTAINLSRVSGPAQRRSGLT